MGFSFMALLGKVVLNYIDVRSVEFNLKFFISLLIALLFAFLGIILNIKGMGFLEERQKTDAWSIHSYNAFYFFYGACFNLLCLY